MIIKIHGENFKAEPNFTVIGYLGEHNARTIDITQPTVEGAESYVLRFEYPDGIIYDVPIVDGKVTVTASLLRVADDVRCQWIAAKPNSEGSYDIVAKSQIFTLTIKPSIGDDVAPIPTPEVAQSVLDEVTQAKEDTIAAKEQAEQAADALQQTIEQVDQNTADIASIRSDASDLIIANPQITDFTHARLNIGPSHIVTFENGKLRQKYTASTGNGFWIMDITPGASESDVLRVKVVVDEILRGQIVVSAVGDSASNNNTVWTTLGRISEAGEYSYDVNLDYLSSVKDVDLSKNIRIVFANSSASSATIPLEDNQLEALYSYAAVYDAVNDLVGTMTEVLNTLNHKIPEGGGSGATFTPSVSAEGVISWTNDKELPNPEPVNIKGPQGERGLQGERGADGYTPVRGVDYMNTADIAAFNAHSDSYVDGKFAQAEQDINSSVQRAEQAASSASQSATNAENTKAEVEAIVYEDVIGDDMLVGVEMNARTTVVTDEQENTPFPTEDYSYKDDTITDPNYSLSDIIELPNGKYRLIADSKCDLYIDVYNPFYGCYSYEDCDWIRISQDDWTETDGKYVCDIEITTSYTTNYARAEIRGSISDWQSYGVELRPITRGSKIIADVHDYIQEHKDEFKGDTGATGATGADGVGITNATINSSNELVLTYSNGQIANLGVVVGADGQDGYTPVRGTDYWTASDIATIDNYIDNEIGNVNSALEARLNGGAVNG